MSESTTPQPASPAAPAPVRSTSRRTRLAAVGAAAVLVATVAPLVTAGPAAALEKHGACGQGARYDFDVDRDDGRYEVSFEVDSNVQGQKWRLALFQNGKRYFRDGRTTDREGEADVERKRVDTRGSDVFSARAVHRQTGRACTVRIVRG